MKLNRILAMAACAAVLTLGVQQASAQGRGNFDPGQMRQRMMDRYRETLDVKDDGEWKVLEEQIGKVFEARMEVGFGFGGGRGMRPSGGRTNDNNSTDQNNRRPRFGGTPSPAAEALQKAIDAKASKDEIKTKLAAYRSEVKAKEAKLEKEQDALRKLLTTRQEAAAVLNGLLK